MATCYLVLGAPRSGTSLAAGILHALGIPMGERIDDPVDPRWDFAGPDDWNQKGFFEDAGFVRWCYGVMGWPWRYPARDLSSEQLASLAALIRERSEAGRAWGVKNAGLVFVLDSFRAACEISVKIVVCRRERSRSSRSWAARRGCSEDEAALIVGAIAECVANVTPDLELSFDDLASWPHVLAEYVGRPLTDAAALLPDQSLVRF